MLFLWFVYDFYSETSVLSVENFCSENGLDTAKICSPFVRTLFKFVGDSIKVFIVIGKSVYFIFYKIGRDLVVVEIILSIIQASCVADTNNFRGSAIKKSR